MENLERINNAYRVGIFGATSAIVGNLISGPIGLFIVSMVQAQPPWQGAQSFAENYHPIQLLPFLGGFLLVLGFVMMIATIYQIAEEKDKTTSMISIILVAMFSVLIVFNYINQTTFLPALVRDYRPEYNSAITTYSMSNPNSLFWAVEMWGFAFLGLATWVAARVFDRDRLERATATLMIANGVISILEGFLVTIDLEWVYSTPGQITYAAWSLLMLAMSICIIASLKRRGSLRANKVSSVAIEGTAPTPVISNAP